ncbi:hypothetical protein L6452_22649 [Arctium lappa]|uniref:Uncharacterized protein n=1 Tax=Arctium lappa TaxID=4217 RepID=A0ACB9B0Q9_ARCLA|nr:hypothetical protein L6452_22649 [Arctium lappa]
MAEDDGQPDPSPLKVSSLASFSIPVPRSTSSNHHHLRLTSSFPIKTPSNDHLQLTPTLPRKRPLLQSSLSSSPSSTSSSTGGATRSETPPISISSLLRDRCPNLPHRLCHLPLRLFLYRLVQSILRPSPASWVIEDDNDDEDTPVKPCGQPLTPHILPANPTSEMEMEKKKPQPTIDYNPEENGEIVKQVVASSIPSYALETKLGDCKRAVGGA